MTNSILIVEDEAIVAADLANKVRQLGYGIAGSTPTGEEAVVLACQQRPALVLMDVRLAGPMDGIATALTIRRECDLPVVFLTAHSDTATVEQVRQTEAFGYITKPFEEHDLRVQLEMALYKHAAEQRLRHSEERFAGIVNSAMDAIVSVDEQQRILLFNAAAERMFGLPAAEALGQPLEMLIPERFRRVHEQHIGQYRQAGLTARRMGALDEICGLRANGEEFPIEASISQVQAAGRKMLTVILRDITERKHFIEQLNHLNATLEQRVAGQTREVRLLAEALSHLAEGVMITDDQVAWPERRIVFVNPAMCRISGYPADELIGQTPRLLHGEGTDPALLDTIQSELAADLPCQAELVNYRKDGTPYPADIVITPLLDADGRRTNSVVIHRDITERKRAEDAQLSLGHIVEESLNEIYVFDAESLKFLQVNRGARANLGYTMAELEKLTPLDLKPAYARKRFAAVLEPLRSRMSDKTVFKTKYRRKDGSYYDVEVHLQMTNYRAKPCFVAFVLDTTRRRELEQEVINAVEKERQRIADDLHDDLGSLLTGIKLRIEALRASLSGTGGKAEESSTIVAQLIRDAITKTRHIARGLHPVDSHPADLMGTLRNFRQQVVATTGTRCRFHCPKPVMINNQIVANQLFRIAQEAVNNALKYSGGTHISISLKTNDDAIELTIADNGKGFDGNTVPGRGLGLHIMNYRADAVNGSLRIEPRKNGGTMVVCTVPADGATG